MGTTQPIGVSDTKSRLANATARKRKREFRLDSCWALARAHSQTLITEEKTGGKRMLKLKLKPDTICT